MIGFLITLLLVFIVFIWPRIRDHNDQAPMEETRSNATNSSEERKVMDVSRMAEKDQQIASDEHGSTDTDLIEDDLRNKDINTFRSCVKEDALVAKVQTHGLLPGMFLYINPNIEVWKEQNLNIALSGSSGSGKSSLINSLRRIKATDEGAAAVGITEITKEEKRYSYPNNDKVYIWDLPGMGTKQFPRDNYLRKIEFEKFDVFLIVFSTRLTENDTWFIRQLMLERKTVMLVRTKIDQDLTNLKVDYPDRYDEEKSLDAVRKELMSALKDEKINLNDNIFLVCSRDCTLYDFPKLDTKVKRLLNRKAIVIRRRIYEIVEEKIRSKEAYCEEKFPWSGFRWYLSYVHPNKDAFYNMYLFCLNEFSLDNKSLKLLEFQRNETAQRNKRKSLQKRLQTEFDSFITGGYRNLLLRFLKLSLPTKMSRDKLFKLMAGCAYEIVLERLDELENELHPLINDQE